MKISISPPPSLFALMLNPYDYPVPKQKQSTQKEDGFCSVSAKSLKLATDLPNSALQILKMANIELSSIRELGGGDNDVYLVNKVWILRIPKHQKAKLANQREQCLLGLLSSQVSCIDIPHYIYWHHDLGAGIYKAIAGDPLSFKIYNNLTPSEREQLALDIAKALSEIHTTPLEVLSLDSASKIASERLDFLESLLPTQNLFSVAECEKIYKAIKQVRFMLDPQSSNQVLLHADLHCENVLFNNRTKCLSGIIDFSDVRMGPAFFDFSGFYRISGQLAERIEQEYAAIMGLNVEQFSCACANWALVQQASAALLNQEAQTYRYIRRLIRAGQALGYLLEKNH